MDQYVSLDVLFQFLSSYPLREYLDRLDYWVLRQTCKTFRTLKKFVYGNSPKQEKPIALAVAYFRPELASWICQNNYFFWNEIHLVPDDLEIPIEKLESIMRDNEKTCICNTYFKRAFAKCGFASGNIKVIEWLLNHCCLERDELEYSSLTMIQRGKLEAYKFFNNTRHRKPSYFQVLEEAILHNQPKFVRWLKEEHVNEIGNVDWRYSLSNALKRGSIECVNELIEYLDDDIIRWRVSAQTPLISLKWLYNLQPEKMNPHSLFSSNLGNIEIMDWIITTFQVKPFNKHQLFIAIYTNNTKLLDWLKVNSYTFEDPYHIAIKSKSIDSLNWLSKNGFKPNHVHFTQAAKENKPKLMDWLFIHHNLKPTTKAFEEAARNGSIMAMRWLLKKGVYWDKRKCLRIASKKSFRWLQDKKPLCK